MIATRPYSLLAVAVLLLWAFLRASLTFAKSDLALSCPSAWNRLIFTRRSFVKFRISEFFIKMCVDISDLCYSRTKVTGTLHEDLGTVHLSSPFYWFVELRERRNTSWSRRNNWRLKHNSWAGSIVSHPVDEVSAFMRYWLCSVEYEWTLQRRDTFKIHFECFSWYYLWI